MNLRGKHNSFCGKAGVSTGIESILSSTDDLKSRCGATQNIIICAVRTGWNVLIRTSPSGWQTDEPLSTAYIVLPNQQSAAACRVDDQLAGGVPEVMRWAPQQSPILMIQ